MCVKFAAIRELLKTSLAWRAAEMSQILRTFAKVLTEGKRMRGPQTDAERMESRVHNL